MAGLPPYGPPPAPGSTAPAPRKRPAWLVPTLLGVDAMVAGTKLKAVTFDAGLFTFAADSVVTL